MDLAAGEGSNQDAAVRIVPATAEQWPRLGHVFGSREKDPSSCWCQRFLRHGESDNRSALRREVQDAEVPIGLLAYLDDSIVGIRHLHRNSRHVPTSHVPTSRVHRDRAHLPNPTRPVMRHTLIHHQRIFQRDRSERHPIRGRPRRCCVTRERSSRRRPKGKEFMIRPGTSRKCRSMMSGFANEFHHLSPTTLRIVPDSVRRASRRDWPDGCMP